MYNRFNTSGLADSVGQRTCFVIEELMEATLQGFYHTISDLATPSQSGKYSKSPTQGKLAAQILATI